MAFAMQEVLTKLQGLSLKLGHDADIRGRVNALLTTSREISDKFLQAVRKEGGSILQQKADMMAATSIKNVDLGSMHVGLQAVRLSFSSAKQYTVVIQADVHNNIEECRARKMAHEQEIVEKEATVSSLQREIGELIDKIATCDKEARDMDTAARELEDRVSELSRQIAHHEKGCDKAAEHASKWALFSVGMSILAWAAAMGLHNSMINQLSGEGKIIREEASKKREMESELRSQSQDLSRQKASLQSEVAFLRKSADELENAARSLADVTSALRTSLEAMNNAIAALQDAETAFKQAKMQGNTFLIIQNAFNANPEKLGGMADAHIAKLKEKWTSVETLLINYGARTD